MQTKIKIFLASYWFLGIILALFAAEAIWLAVTSKFQMAFDEAHHFGLIQFFAHNPSPFVSMQPASSYNLGALNHNPSFLYHLLMSFPYRLITVFTSNLKTTIISLRFINIALALVNLLVVRRLLKLINVPNILANVTILAFAFTPIVTVLAAQINYDNLLILFVSLTIYQTVKFIKQLQIGEFKFVTFFSIICLALFGSVVKYAFLAVPISISLILLVAIWRYLKDNQVQFIKTIKQAANEVSLPARVVLISLSLVGLGLFGAFYGVNLVKYHNPVPTCDQILTIKDCKLYYAWNRNHDLAIHKSPGVPVMNVFNYSLLWGKEMYYQIFAEIVPTGGLVPVERIYRLIVVSLSIIGVMCLLAAWRKVFDSRSIRVLTLVSISYLLVLLARNYHDYLNLGQAVAIQGRFLLPVLVYVYVLLGYSYYYALSTRRIWQQAMLPVVTGLVIISFIYWGGYVRYVQTISPNYGWQNSPKLIHKS